LEEEEEEEDKEEDFFVCRGAADFLVVLWSR
jgi:hypothetical protein